MALCLGGLDPSGGAGLIRDAVSLWEAGAVPMAVTLAETLQNGVKCARILPPALQPLSRLQELVPHLAPGTWGAKVGLCAVPAPELGELATLLAQHGPRALVWDPILGPSCGDALHAGRDLLALAEALLPKGPWLVTPNLVEARAAAEADGIQQGTAEALASVFLARGASAVWLKGGHGVDNGIVEDLWITAAGTRSLGRHPRLPGDRRGTGCTLAATWLACTLAGLDAFDAATEAARRLRARWSRAGSPGGFGRPCFLPEMPC